MYSCYDHRFFIGVVAQFGDPRILRLFTAPRGLSQLVASFVGSWCQGIHLMLFFAWTSFVFSSYLLLWVSQIIFVLQWKSFFRCFLWSSAISDGLIVVFYPILFRKTWFKILKKLSVRFNISLFGFQWSFTFSTDPSVCCWWAQVDSNHRPRAYQARALTCWAMSPFSLSMYLVHLFAIFRSLSASLVEMMGFEPMTPCLQGRCSPSWATPPY